MYQDLLKTVLNLGKPKVLIVGDLMLDVYVYGDAERISPEAPVPVLKIKGTEFRCGGAASVAADIAALGAVPISLGVIGQDHNGKTLSRLLSQTGADISGLFITSDRPTISKQRLIGLAQHRHQQQLFRMDEELTEPFTDKQYSKILQNFQKKLKNADIVCLQDYNKGLLAPDVCQQMIKSAKKAGKKVLVDPSPISDYTKYAGATLITPNRRETSLAVNFKIETQKDYSKAAEILTRKLRLDAAVITLDKEGAFLKAKGINELIPTRPRTVYDVTGAGDMVLATLAVTLAAGCDYRQAVEIANFAGGIEVEKFGVATVSIEEITNEIIRVNRGKSGKVRDIYSLVPELNYHRKQGKKIVFTNGCFDVIHRGHIEYLNFCKLHGDIVVVGVNSDKSVKKIKGPDRPINNENDRASVLAGLETIDYVIIFNEPDPLNLIKKVKPDILVKGRDWAKKGVIGREFVESTGGKVVLAPLVKGQSSTKIIQKMKSQEA